MTRAPLVLALAVVSLFTVVPRAARADDFAFGGATHLKDSDAGTEPRVTVTPDDRRYVITNKEGDGTAIVYRSDDFGGTWAKTPGDFTQGASPTIDVDVVGMRTNRILVSELDLQAVSFFDATSDDGGKTYQPSSGGDRSGDTDRQWFAVGPDDPSTHLPRVYLLYHNLASGTGQHNMFVVTSTDGGRTFGVPVPVAQPPSQAYQDLQCSDSGGPSSISVNPRTGRVYVVWGTRTAPAGGGCGASVFGPFEVNVVGATRIWVGTSPDGSAGSWETKLAVDDKGDNKIRGMQLAPGTLDNQGNLYVVYPESLNEYPDYNGAAIKYVAFKPDLSPLAGPFTVAESGGAGNVVPHVVAGDPGKLGFAWYHGELRGSDKRPAWYTMAAQTLDGLGPAPHIAQTRLSDVVAYTGTASELMGACGEGPAEGVENGFACTRSTDVWGVALDGRCRMTVTWPTRDNLAFAKRNQTTTQKPYGPAFEATPNEPGTFVATQSGGPGLCGDPGRAGAGNPPGAALPPAPGGCADVRAPRSRAARSSRITRRGVRLSGRSRDRGCDAPDAALSVKGEVSRVLVAIGRSIHGGGCKYLRASGRFGKRRPCARTQYIVTRGTKHWRLRIRHRIPRGSYQIWVRGIDARGNVERKAHGRNLIKRRVK
ncbi:MAG TPA: sialidase family protein [Solirubrobacteraceae bacterium]